ncbi:hypothetical protein [Spirosoma foliorum]|uniref:Uncharacterized protein n=1 Tax=Spirosoma foliorum TaxID=2710596 RepID=A0A7G5GS95_9BACT|nr:hypothetical protein [Spirosoma foliorum]QMW01737.1 hypothetical protein H3H32_27890 [Spirosoma foliorum]
MTLYDILDLILYVSTAVVLIPIGLGVRYWSELSARERGLIWFLTGILIVEVADTILRYSYIRNHFTSYFRTLAVLLIGAYFYGASVGWGRWPLFLSGLVTVLLPVEVVGWVGFNHINSLTRSVAWFLLAMYAFRSLIRLFDQPNEVSLRQQPTIYYDLGFFLMGFVSAGTKYFENYFIETSLDLYYFFDTFTVMINALAFGLFSIGLVRKHRTTDLRLVS